MQVDLFVYFCNLPCCVMPFEDFGGGLCKYLNVDGWAKCGGHMNASPYG